MFADPIPRKNFPISVPALFQTCEQRAQADVDIWKKGRKKARDRT